VDCRWVNAAWAVGCWRSADGSSGAADDECGQGSQLSRAAQRGPVGLQTVNAARAASCPEMCRRVLLLLLVMSWLCGCGA